MNMRRLPAGLLLLLACVAGCSQDEPEAGAAEQAVITEEQQTAEPDRKGSNSGTPKPYHGELPSLAALNIRDARIEKILDDLELPWAFEFIDSNELLITELPGRLSRLRLDSGELTPLPGMPEVAQERQQTGLLDIEIHPEFADNQRIYFSYVISNGESEPHFMTVIATAVLHADEVRNVRDIVRAEPFDWSQSNFGGALEFDDQGYLYISIGDRSNPDHAQYGERLHGKILRLHDDGSVPDDNPFIDDPQIDDRIYALGVRNPQGLDYDAGTGLLFEAEHGPMGGDEINIIEAGVNYGWPVATYGLNYTTWTIGAGTHRDGTRQPLFYYLPSAAISPLAVYRGDMFPQWEGDLLIGALRGEHVSRIDLDGMVVRSEYPILNELEARIRDIKVAADGSVYILTQPGDLYRLFRDPSLDDSPVDNTTPNFYNGICAACHDEGVNGAPRIGVAEDWEVVLQQPLETVYRNTLQGIGAMPERGLCYSCSDDKVRKIVDYMISESRPAKPESTDQASQFLPD